MSDILTAQIADSRKSVEKSYTTLESAEEELHRQLNRLADISTDFESKLHRIMRPSTQVDAPSSTAHDMDSPLGYTVMNVANSIREITNSLEDMYRRVDL